MDSWTIIPKRLGRLLACGAGVLFVALITAHSVAAQCPGLNLSIAPTQTVYCGSPANVIINNTSTGANASTATYQYFQGALLYATIVGTGAATHPAQPTGTYTYSVIATDTAGCRDTVTVNISVVPTPVAGFTFAPNNQCAYTPVVFTNTSTGTFAGTTYLWNFGDGQSSTAANPTHAYNAPGGTFNVTLTVTNGAGCTSVFNQNVTVTTGPNPGIAGDDGDGNTVYCLLPGDPATVDPVTFSNTTTGAGPINYSWNFGDGSPIFNTGSTASFVHNYTAFGTYTVTMTATGPNGCTGVATLTVVFERRPTASMSITPAENGGCTPHTVCPLNLSQNATNFFWNFGDGFTLNTTSMAAPCHTYTVGGTYTISLTASNSCPPPSTATVGPIIVTPPPLINFNMNPNPGCAPQVVNFTNSSTGAVPVNSYTWHFGRFPGDSLVNVYNPPNQTYGYGVWTVMLVGRNACGTDTLIRQLIIDTIPRPLITVNPTLGCTPLTVTVTNNTLTPGLTPLVHQWFIDGSPFPTYTTYNIPPQVFTAPAGNNPVVHTIRYRVSNGCGARDTTVSVTVHPAVVAQFNANPVAVCEGGNITFTQNSFGSNLTYNWNFGNGNTSTTVGPHTQTYPTAGTFNVSLIVNGFCGADTMIVPVTIRPYPVINFTTVPDSGCAPLTIQINNSSTPGGINTWNFGAGAVPATSNVYAPPNVTYSTPGSSIITYTIDLNGCSATGRDTVIIRPRPVPTFTALPAAGCTPLTVTYTNNTATVGGETWAWDFGDGATSNLQNPPPHVYTNPGPGNLIRTVKLVVTNGFSCTDSTTRNITIYPLPVAGFTNPATACVTFQVPFTNTSTGASTYSWNFGDGGTSTATNPTHAYTATGTYTVTLIAISSFGCRDTTTGSVILDTIPDAQWVADTVCIGNTTTFTDLSAGAPMSWAWTFGDGGTSTTQNPTHTYAAPGTYTVKLVVTNATGCPDSLIRQVLVNPVPVASFTAPPACHGAANQFTSTSTGNPTVWNWDFGDLSTGTGANPTHVYALPGTYNVTLIVFSGVGCSDTITQAVVVNPVPVAAFTADTVCYLLTTSFTDLSGGVPNTWNWAFGDGGTSTLQNPTHFYTAAGSYNVTLIAGYAATGCTDTVQATVIVHPRPIAAFTTGPVCLNDTTQFQDLSTNTPNQWLWDFGDATTSTVQNPVHVYGSPTTYNVSLWVQNAFGCADSITQSVTVYPRPVADFQADTVCQNLWTTFGDLSTAAVTWHYDFGDGDTSNASSPSHMYLNAGTFTVTQIVWNIFGCTDTIQRNIVVDSLPVAEFAVDSACFGFANQFTDLSTVNAAGLAWNWDFGDTAGTSTVQHPAYVYGDSGTYTVTLIVQNNLGCGDTISHPVIVFPIPIAGWVNPTACARNVVQFTDTTTSNPNQWLWDFGDGAPSETVQHPAHVYTVGGSYNVTLIAGNSVGCFDTTTLAIPVYTVPVPEFTADTVCQGLVTSFTNGSTDPNPMSYLWNFGDGNSSPAQDPQYIYADSGLFTVQLTTFNVYGCRDSIFHDVYVAPLPAVDFAGDTVCLGQPTTFAGLTSSYATSWAWDFGDGGTSSVQNPIHTFNTQGNQTVSLWAGTAFGCSDSITRNIFVEDAPVANFDFSALHCAGTAIDFNNLTIGPSATMTWTFGDGGTSAAVDPSHTYANPGTYSITLISSSSNGCADTVSSTLEVHVLPQADFAADTVCIGGFTQFADASTGDSLSTWYWDFGNNSNTAYGQTPGHVYYPSADTFTVSLIVTNVWGCTDTTAGNVLVTPTAVAAFISDPTLPAQLELYESTVNFTNQSLFADFWSWDFGDGGTSTVYSPSHTYTGFGDYCVTLAVQSIGGCTDTLRVCNLVILAGIPDIPNTFSPNGDGTNDVFEIRNIDAFPDNTLQVFNRWGNKVYEKDRYHNDWDGRNWRNDQLLPDGAYFYVFKPSPEAKEIVGDVVIFR